MQGKPVRSHSMDVTIARDYQRVKIVQKLDLKLTKDYIDLERRFNSHVKWNQRANCKNLRQITASSIQDKPPMTLEEFLQREKNKYNNILNSKELANENIRRK